MESHPFIKLFCCAIELLSMLPANVFVTGSHCMDHLRPLFWTKAENSMVTLLVSWSNMAFLARLAAANQHGSTALQSGMEPCLAFTSLAWQYKVEGRSQVKGALCAAIQAKNSTITKGGYTPFQLAFGRQPMFPDLLEENVEGNMSLRESLSLEGEVQRAAEMRAAARATLLRHDVQAKLRKALRRWPKGE